ncbi:hypothetical protein [Butyrivibrio sp. YAB3001]|uniref:hypothetical protein n=1 Tax=Butyrivibrio sp. YAB3001 TaxID=1520812 RepID=UPI0008F61BC8|nr:hypothetical protein [Butyrivibrio sp. YAB3001]SFC60547.1 hypothetical protein SAMN02910398_02667 [Butyrivibrio sp. YAB3001]
MVTTVTLQQPFEYYWWVILIAVMFFILATVLLILALNKVFHFLSHNKKKKPVITRPPRRALYAIKADYSAQLQDLAEAYTNKKLDKRIGYQRLSLLIRGFVQEVTGLNVENFTKAEIKAFGIKKLDKLMDEYYVPEFAETVRSINKDFIGSCNNALGVIQSWN